MLLLELVLIYVVYIFFNILTMDNYNEYRNKLLNPSDEESNKYLYMDGEELKIKRVLNKSTYNRYLNKW